MLDFNLYSEFYKQPILLTEEEKQDPLPVTIRQFFEDVRLVEVRIHLYNLLEVTLTTSNTIYNDKD